MNIDGVSTGIVLDHIQAGRSMEIYEYLGLDPGARQEPGKQGEQLTFGDGRP